MTHILELMRATEKTFLEFGGHAKAGGFTVRDTEVFFLEDRLVEAHERMLDGKIMNDELIVRADAEVIPEETTIAFLAKVEKLAPFGMHNDKPVFLLREVLVREISHFGKGEEHLKLRISSVGGNGTSIDAVTFFIKGSVARTAKTLAAGSRVNMLAHLERDTFSRGNPVRLRLLDIKIV